MDWGPRHGPQTPRRSSRRGKAMALLYIAVSLAALHSRRGSPMTALTKSVDLERRGRVAVITVNNPPVNALSQHVRQGLRDGVVQAVADSGVTSIVITCAGRTFIAGADITE